MNQNAPFLSLLPSASRFSLRSLLTLVAIAPAACTFTIEDPTPGEPTEVCPMYEAAPCVDGSYPSTEVDEYGCDVPVCISCPAAPDIECPPDQWLEFSLDEHGCDVSYCTGGGIACPEYDLEPCPPGTEVQFSYDPWGCSVPSCVPVGNCPPLPLPPTCPYGQHIEYVMSDCGCEEPRCVPDYGCDRAINGGAGDAIIAPGSDAGVSLGCGCLPYIAEPCPEGYVGFDEYDAYGCPVYTCHAVNDCVIGGCSGQLCGEPGDDLVSTCEWHDSYGCYQKVGQCERQADGQCGWTPTEELNVCLKETGALLY